MYHFLAIFGAGSMMHLINQNKSFYEFTADIQRARNHQRS